MKIKNGDLLQIKLEDDVGYAEKVGNHNQEYEVYFICNIKDNEYVYESDYHVVPKESIMKHIRTEKGDYKSAWNKLGFDMISDDDKISFYRHDNYVSDNESIMENSLDKSSDSLDSIDTYSDDSISVHSSDIEFIDDSCISTTTTCNTDCTCEVCSDIKQSNDAFNTFVPSTPLQKYVKQVIDKIETRVIHEMDDMTSFN